MVRLQLILPLLLWVAWRTSASAEDIVLTSPLLGTAIYLAGLLFIVLAVRSMARRAMRRNPASAGAGIGRLHQTIFAARWLILGLHTFALFALGYGDFVWGLTPPITRPIETLPALLSLVPVPLAWLGLVWAEHPLDRAVREQNAVYAFEFGEPVYPIPTFGQQLLAAFRLQILFTLLPTLLISFTHDIASVLYHTLGRRESDAADLATTVLAAGLVFLLSPELLRRVLPTSPLPPSELRDRLQALCERLQLRYREILLWRTHHTVDNAAVMGLVPQVRYILLSDLLISTMTQDQIEAVFAHEAGHVKHGHMAWYLVFFLTLMLGLNAFATAMLNQPWMPRHFSGIDTATLISLLGIVAIFLGFGVLSRSMERQADVFAARVMTSSPAEPGLGRDGVAVFCSALAQVARVNNMPLDGSAAAFGQPLLKRVLAKVVSHSVNWLHGSIRSRLDYLQSLVGAPDRLAAFDRKMVIVRLALLASFAGSIAWTAMTMAK